MKELHRLLLAWPEIPLEKALQLLDYACNNMEHILTLFFVDPDERIHEYAVRCLERENDEKLEMYMNQLVQVIVVVFVLMPLSRPSSTKTSMTAPLVAAYSREPSRTSD